MIASGEGMPGEVRNMQPTLGARVSHPDALAVSAVFLAGGGRRMIDFVSQISCERRKRSCIW